MVKYYSRWRSSYPQNIVLTMPVYWMERSRCPRVSSASGQNRSMSHGIAIAVAWRRLSASIRLSCRYLNAHSTPHPTIAACFFTSFVSLSSAYLNLQHSQLPQNITMSSCTRTHRTDQGQIEGQKTCGHSIEVSCYVHRVYTKTSWVQRVSLR